MALRAIRTHACTHLPTAATSLANLRCLHNVHSVSSAMGRRSSPFLRRAEWLRLLAERAAPRRGRGRARALLCPPPSGAELVGASRHHQSCGTASGQQATNARGSVCRLQQQLSREWCCLALQRMLAPNEALSDGDDRVPRSSVWQCRSAMRGSTTTNASTPCS
jgi:hypothetical protein